jgi:hypothetical protein
MLTKTFLLSRTTTFLFSSHSLTLAFCWQGEKEWQASEDEEKSEHGQENRSETAAKYKRKGSSNRKRTRGSASAAEEQVCICHFMS